MAIAELAVNLVANTGTFVKNMNAVARNIDKTGRQMQSAGKAILGITAPIAAFGGSAFKMSSDFNKSMASVEVMISRVATEGGKDIKALKKDVLDLSSSTGKSAQEIAEGMFQVISTFGNTAEASSQLNVATKAALAGGATVSETIGLLGVVSKNFGETSAEAQQKIVDLAFVTNELGVTTFQELAQSMTLVAPIAASVGVSMDELFASYSALTGVTGNTSVVSTQFRAALVSLQKPTEDMAKILQSLGYETGEALLKEKGLLGAFQAVTKEAEAKNINLGKALSSVESLSFVTALTTTQSEKFSQALLANAGAAGTGAKAYETYTQGLGASDVKMNQLIQTSKNMIIQLGDELAPVILDVLNNAIIPLMNSIQSLIKSFSSLDPETKKIIIQITAWGAAIGATLLIVGKFITALTAIYKAKVLLLPLLGLLKVAVAGLAKAGFLLLLNPIGLTITAIAALAAGIYYFRDSIKPAIESIKNFTIELGSKLQTGAKIAVKSVELMMKEIWEYISSGFNKVLNIVSDATKKVTGFFDDMYMAVVGNSIVPDMADEIIDEFWIMHDQMQSITSSATKFVERDFSRLENNLSQNTFNGLADSLSQSILRGFETGFSSESINDFANSASQVFANKFQQGFSGLFESGGFTLDNIGGAASNLGIAYGVSSLAQNLSDNERDPEGGVVSGAVLGASIGTQILPGWGTVIGGVVGAGAGYLAGNAGQSNEAGASARWDTVGWIEDKIGGSYLPFLTEQGNIILGDSRRFSADPGGGFFTRIGRDLGEFYAERASPGIDWVEGVNQDVSDAKHGSEFTSVPGQISGGEWADQYWGTFGETTGQQFRALGIAMTEFAGVTAEEGEKIGLVLAENLNGNLDNARLLLQTMKISAADLESALMQVGLSGEQTWHEIEVALQQIPALTGEGLVAFGDLAGAINGVKDSGNRGEAALIQLRNVIVEAKELGVKNFGELREAMLAQGVSVEDVDVLFQAFAQRGINSIEDFGNASDRQIGGVLADMESLGFSFKDVADGIEGASQSVESLEKRLDKLDNKKVQVEVEVKYKETGKKPDSINTEVVSNKGAKSITVPALDTGGIVSNPTLALIGERRKEAVIPLDELPSMMENIMARAGSVTDKIMGSVFNIDARGAVRGVGEEIKNALINFTDTRNGLLGTT